MAKLIDGLQHFSEIYPTHKSAYKVYTYGSKTRRDIYSFGIRGSW
jgi:hypothetical protein